MRRMLKAGGAAVAMTAATLAAAQTPAILPGQWESSTTISIKALPGTSPQVLAMLAKQQARPVVVRTCVTPQEAARGPVNSFSDRDCKLVRSSYGGGRMSAETVCNRNGMVTRMTMTGRYTPTSYTIEGAMNGASGSRPMAMTVGITGRRVAATCAAR